MYNNIIFDLYGTLIDIKTDEERAEFWDSLAAAFNRLGAPYEPPLLRERYLTLVAEALAGNTKTQYPDTRVYGVLDKLLKEKGVISDHTTLYRLCRQFRRLSTIYITLYPGIRDMLALLTAAGKRLFILSNGQREFSEGELQDLGIYSFFKGLYFSADYEISKPDPGFFRILLDREGLQCSDCIMIGNDHTTDIAGAAAVGMDSLYIHSNHSHPIMAEQVSATYRVVAPGNVGQAVFQVLGLVSFTSL